MEDLHNALIICKKQLATLENHKIALKTQLADILQYHFDRALLEKLEYFHTAFLQQDTRFEAFRSEMALQRAWLAQPYTDPVNRDNIYRHQRHMQETLDKMDNDVQRLTNSFTDYLHINFPQYSPVHQ
jgi:hypothetical protein